MATHGADAEAGVPARVGIAKFAVPHQENTVRALISPTGPAATDDLVETELLDLSEVFLSTLNLLDPAAVLPSVHRILAQVDRPRANLGGSGPPGRVD